MAKVTGIGGVFFKCKDPDALRNWYRDHLGIDVNAYGATFEWRNAEKPEETGCTQWSPFAEHSTYFAPSTKDFMINYRVDDLEALVEKLKSESVEIVGELQVYDYGKFAHVMDPEGNKLELWEPK